MIGAVVVNGLMALVVGMGISILGMSVYKIIYRDAMRKVNIERIEPEAEPAQPSLPPPPPPPPAKRPSR